jgi:hypothetical protein
MPRRFALDQNFPEPIVDGLADWLAPDAELVPIRRIDARMATLDDWEVLAALHADDRLGCCDRRSTEVRWAPHGSAGLTRELVGRWCASLCLACNS